MEEGGLPLGASGNTPVSPSRPCAPAWPVLGERPFVRFRYDCLMAGFALRDDLKSNERIWAIEHFRAAAESSVARVAHTLQPDEALIVDNHTMLHARSHFADPDRHLIRVRMHAAA